MTLLTSDQNTFEQPQDDDIVLSVNNVSKRFCRDLKKSLFYGIQDIAGEVFGDRRKNVELRKGEFWALNDVSFQLRRGESLGLVGANGAGKTTLLRIISGLIKPDHGSVEIKGRVAPLIALGAGFNPILTGRENIYVNMSILGLSKEEINERFDQVVEFAEIGEAIDAPVQSYSSGMAARLGFASAIHTEPDILLIDEVLAVGDIKFKEKCHRRLAKLRQQGKSFILVSHSSPAILKVCNSAVYLSKGNVVDSGNANAVVSGYENDIFTKVEQKDYGSFFRDKKDCKNEILNITHILFKDSRGEKIKHPITGSPISICIGCYSNIDINNLGVFITLDQVHGDNERVLLLSNINDCKYLQISKGQIEINIQMPYFGLRNGLYILNVIIREGSLNTLDFVDNFEFKVISQESMDSCRFYQPRDWSVQKSQLS
jgi:lipopolysaccharide transport system ATP-binding protein